MADVGGDSGGATDIVQTQGGNERIGFEQERERLADSSTRAKDSNLGVTGDGRREPTTVNGKTASGVSSEHFFEWKEKTRNGERWDVTGRLRPRFVPSPAFPRSIINGY